MKDIKIILTTGKTELEIEDRFNDLMKKGYFFYTNINDILIFKKNAINEEEKEFGNKIYDL